MKQEKYVRDSKIEKEVKFAIKDISSTLIKIRNVAKFIQTEYIRDIIYGVKNDKQKIRVRIFDNFNNHSIEAMYKYRTDSDDSNIKTEVEETIYRGSNFKDALTAIAKHGDFKEENSYEKIRAVYKAKNAEAEITFDIYPYGVWMEIEGDPENIWLVADKLGFEKKDSVVLNADELYLEWQKKFNLKEMWDVRFGLTGEK